MCSSGITEGKCSGCHACYSVCPKKAITMQPDAEGFLYPTINEALCVDCGLCRAVCPVNQQHTIAGDKKAYAAKNRDDAVRANSSSGGIFSLLAESVLTQGGVVFGAGFDRAFAVAHMAVHSSEALSNLRGSKYVQSRIGETFLHVEQYLKDKKPVLFTGTPCQIAGLHNYLKQKKIDTEKLYLVDLICHGVPSPLVWEKYLQSISNGKTVTSINFRDKSRSWSSFSLAISFADGTQYKALANEDAYFKGFFANMTLRPSCHACAQKNVDRASDLTIADCWGIDHFLPEMNDKKGTSAIITHTEKGAQLLRSINDLAQIREVPIEKVLRYNLAMTESAPPHPRRESFFALLQNGENVVPAIEQILKPTFKEQLKKVEVAAKRFGRKILKRNK